MLEPTLQPCVECQALAVKKIIRNATHAFMSPEALGRLKAPEDFRNFVSAIRRAHPDGHVRDH